MANDFDLEALVHLEQTAYDAGYADGFAHGRIHGLIDGRALGRENGFEIWEEIGFYEGFARTWQAIHARARGPADQRPAHHIRHLLALIRQFPTVNPSAAAVAASYPDAAAAAAAPAPAAPLDRASGDEIDLVKLQRQIRSRYRALCASLGVPPTLRVGAGHDDAGEGHGDDGRDPQHAATRTATRSVWSLEDGTKRPSVQGLSF